MRIRRYGGPDVLELEDVPRPEAGPGEVLVRVAAAGVHPTFAPGARSSGSYAFRSLPAATPSTSPPPPVRSWPSPRCSHAHAAALPLVALTAWQALFGSARLEEGETVLVHAAAGGVGHVAVQLAKW